MATIEELISSVYKDNYPHLDFIENMNGGDCDCAVHLLMNTLNHYKEVANG